MKCPNCSANQKYSDGMTCRSCRYHFVFDPKSTPFADGKFSAGLRRVSGEGSYYFTMNQLYAEMCRRTTMSFVPIAIGLVVVGTIVSFAFESIIPGMVLGVIGVICLIVGFVSDKPLLDRERFPDYVQRWESMQGRMEKLIREPRLTEPPPEWGESDIYDYGVERILIVERDELVDLFVLNGFHATHSTLVLSEKGYPSYLVSRVAQLLKDSPQLPVFLLHDSTYHGTNMRHRLRAGNLFDFDKANVTDLGLRPEDVKLFKAFKATGPKKLEYKVPVDYLLFLPLSTIVAGGLLEGMTIAELTRARRQNEVDSFG